MWGYPYRKILILFYCRSTVEVKLFKCVFGLVWCSNYRACTVFSVKLFTKRNYFQIWIVCIGNASAIPKVVGTQRSELAQLMFVLSSVKLTDCIRKIDVCILWNFAIISAWFAKLQLLTITSVSVAYEWIEGWVFTCIFVTFYEVLCLDALQLRLPYYPPCTFLIIASFAFARSIRSKFN